MTKICVASNKGGCAKTTTSVSLAAGLANTGRKVLLVDGDNQGHITLSFGLPVRSGLFDWLVQGLPLHDCTLSGRPSGLTILPGDSLTKTVERLFSDSDEFVRLVALLRGLPQPYVIFDTAAGGLFQEAALAAADMVIIPFRCEQLGIDSLYQTMDLIRQLAPGAPVTLLPTAFDVRLSEQKERLQQVVNEYAGAHGLDRDWDSYVIRNRVAVAQAVGFGKTIWEYKADGILDVRRGYSQLINRVLALAESEPVKEGKVLHGNID